MEVIQAFREMQVLSFQAFHTVTCTSLAELPQNPTDPVRTLYEISQRARQQYTFLCDGSDEVPRVAVVFSKIDEVAAMGFIWAQQFAGDHLPVVRLQQATLMAIVSLSEVGILMATNGASLMYEMLFPRPGTMSNQYPPSAAQGSNFPGEQHFPEERTG